MLLLKGLVDPALSRAITSRYRQDRGATVLEVRTARRRAHLAAAGVHMHIYVHPAVGLRL